MDNYRICDRCDGKMRPQKFSHTFQLQGKVIEIKGIEGYICPQCGEKVFLTKEVKMIDKIIHAIDDKPTIDVLNLEETAEYLRVSNQTVYNMIRDGRIKAYKIGREWRFLRADIISYLNASSSDNLLSMAAKGGDIDTHDLDIIMKEINKRKKKPE